MRIGLQEAFLLSLLDGNTTVAEILERFEREFGESITDDDVREFVALAKKEGLLKRSKRRLAKDAAADIAAAKSWRIGASLHQASQEAESAVLSGQTV